MKRVLLFMVSALTMLAMSACQQTPPNEIVANKGNDMLQEKINGEPVARKKYEAPKHIKIDSFGDKTLQIMLDAEVKIPDVVKLPVVQIKKREIDDAWAKEILFKMSGGKPLLNVKDEEMLTKGELEDEILRTKKRIANPQEILGDDIEEQERAEYIRETKEELMRLEEAYKTAPETFEQEEIRYEFIPMTPSMVAMGGEVHLGKKRKAYMEISKSENNVGGYVEFNNMDDGVGPPLQADNLSQFEQLNGVSISEEQAIQMGIDYLEKLGETGFAPALVLGGYCEAGEDTPFDKKTCQNCYKIYFTRTIEGVATTFRNTEQDGFLVGEYQEKVDEMRQFAPFWPQESVQMVIRDSGVNAMFWEMPTGNAEVLNNNVELLPFEEICDRFQSQVLYEMLPSMSDDPAAIKKTLVIDKIELGMMQVRNKNEYDSLLMVPTWSFFGKEIFQYDDPQPGGFVLNENNEYIREIPGHSFMTINAVDGTVINPIFGY